VREALGKPAQGSATYALLQESLGQIEEKAAAIRARLDGREAELLSGLAEVAQLRGWQVARASNPEEALDYIYGLATTSESRLVMRSDQVVFDSMPVDGSLGALGVQVTTMSQASGLSPEALRAQVAEAGLGITGVDYAIAETGSVVLLPRQGLSRLVSLVPPVHVVLVRPFEVLETLDDLFVLRRLAYHHGDGDMGSYMNIITGPSRTADIEQTIVIGVHGPKEAHMILLE
jgi:L-lactate dehydrogenase complex protein LldG